MRLPTLFKQQGNKKFAYSPRYYDERKERIERLSEEKMEIYKGLLKQQKSYRNDWKSTRSTMQTNTKLRLIIIFLFLVISVWLAFRTV